MSLRILVKPDQVQKWIVERNGTPARRVGSDADLRLLFDKGNSDCEPITVDELIETMRFNHLAILVDQEPGKTFYRFVVRG